MKRTLLTKSLALMLALNCGLMMTGCNRSTDDMQQVVEQLTQQQLALQNELLKQSQRLSAASESLVKQDAEARREFAAMQTSSQESLFAERQKLDQHKALLEDERRKIAKQRHRDPLIATALLQGTTLTICCLPILLVVAVYQKARQEPDSDALNDLLLSEFVSEQPRLLPVSIARLEEQPVDPSEQATPAIGSDSEID
jgi:hypothetical protein